MKIRNGFVSNSSSSSFVIIGVLSDKILDKSMDYVYLDDDSSQCVTGYMVASGDECDFGGGMTYAKLKECVEKIKEKLGVGEDEIEIYSGVMMC